MAYRDAQYRLKDNIEADEIFIGGKQSLDERIEYGTNKGYGNDSCKKGQQGMRSNNIQKNLAYSSFL